MPYTFNPLSGKFDFYKEGMSQSEADDLYLPLLGGTINGDLDISGILTAGIIDSDTSLEASGVSTRAFSGSEVTSSLFLQPNASLSQDIHFITFSDDPDYIQSGMPLELIWKVDWYINESNTMSGFMLTADGGGNPAYLIANFIGDGGYITNLKPANMYLDSIFNGYYQYQTGVKSPWNIGFEYEPTSNRAALNVKGMQAVDSGAACTFTNGSNVATGTGLLSKLKVGQVVKVPCNPHFVSKIINLSDTQVTFNDNFTGYSTAYGLWVDENLIRVDNGVGEVYLNIDNMGAINLYGNKIGFLGADPVGRQAHIADADGTLADLTAKFNTLLSYLENYGLIKTS